jgi:WD40 repeat protein
VGHTSQVTYSHCCAGTIFHTILVWTAQLKPGPNRSCKVAQCAPHYKLCGHCGSVLRLQWAANLTLLLTTADDRTARVWRLPENWWLPSVDTLPGSTACDPTQSRLVHSLWGHTARVWDVTLIGSCASELLQTELSSSLVHGAKVDALLQT